MKSERKCFCENCRDDVGYIVHQQQLVGKIKGKEYLYLGERAYCLECKNEVYVHEVNDENLKALYNRYREENDIISLDKINEIPRKYGIGKRPLSLLLGWGELTYSRYCDGDVPTQQYSQILKKLDSDPNYYDQLLEENQSKLKNKSAYEKSKKVVRQFIDSSNKVESKIDLCIGYLLNQCQDITPLALQKALYYIQGFYYAFNKQFLFKEECQAWIHGPVYKEIYFRYCGYRFDPIECRKEFDDSVFSSAEKAILDSVVRHICCYSGKVLEKFTHCEEPWLIARGNLPESESSENIIEKKIIGSYFNSVKEKYHMLSTNDIQLYTSSMFRQI